MRRLCLVLTMFLTAAGGIALAGEEDEYIQLSLIEAASLRNLMLYREAIPIYQELLTMDLPIDQRIEIHVLLACCYERVDGETARHIWRLEAGTRPRVAAVTLARIALALDTSVDYLLGLTDNPWPPDQSSEPRTELEYRLLEEFRRLKDPADQRYAVAQLRLFIEHRQPRPPRIIGDESEEE